MASEKRQMAPLTYELPDPSQFLVLDPEEETLDAQLLVQGFEAFNQATQKLQDYYRGIEQKVDELNSELARKNRELEQNLLEKDRVKSHLNNIFESSALGIVVTDLQGEILSVNQKALRLLNKMAEEVRGLRLNEILGERILPLRLTPEFMQNLQQGQEQEMTLRGGAGLSRQLRLHLSLMKSDQNEWLGLIINIQDITDLRKLEEEAERKNRFTGMGQMAASIAHEIRNPLGSIELFTSLLRKEVQSDSSQQLVHHISSAVQSMNHIISNLLEYTKPRPVAREVIDLHKFLRENLSFFEQLVEYNSVEMRTDFLATNTKIRGEVELLKQVFHNILINAIQAMVEEGEIRLTTRNILT
ncbi:MAG: histidine kinase dimerization/phospho-acceptor domain-containing protein, partial [SAR324 cluster bacterium]|nr:histidine kinase dimerization/phospho-acceptor domain-containing protein [SAR324 cluster bacterium]